VLGHLAVHFDIRVPGSNTSTFQFSLASKPADLFSVAYTSRVGDETDRSPLEIYSAMADSTFDDFGAKLLSELSVR
jgi:hypothetical protein